MAVLCTWCRTEHEAGADGFCSDGCHQKFSTACQLWAEEQYGCGELSIFQLRTCLGRREQCSRADPASEGTKAPETKMRPGGTPSAADAVAENSP